MFFIKAAKTGGLFAGFYAMNPMGFPA